MEKTKKIFQRCGICDGKAKIARLVTLGDLSAVNVINKMPFTKPEKIHAYICLDCGHVSFYVEDVSFLN